MPKRTPDNCSIIKKYGEPGRCSGKCNGFAVSDANDEPCYPCKRCTYYISYEAEDAEWKG